MQTKSFCHSLWSLSVFDYVSSTVITLFLGLIFRLLVWDILIEGGRVQMRAGRSVSFSPFDPLFIFAAIIIAVLSAPFVMASVVGVIKGTGVISRRLFRAGQKPGLMMLRVAKVLRVLGKLLLCRPSRGFVFLWPLLLLLGLISLAVSEVLQFVGACIQGKPDLCGYKKRDI